MNAYERTIATCRGQARDRLSCQPIFMTFAAKLHGVTYADYVRDYRNLVGAQCRLAEEFDIDVVSCCSDAWREAADCGAELTFYADGPPACRHHVLADKADLASLAMPDPTVSPRMSDRVQAVGLFAERVKGEIPVMGWIEGPVAQAADLRGINELMLDTMDDLPFVTDLFEFVTELEIAFARAQLAAGADIIGLGDAAASLVSAGFYEEHALRYERRMVEAIQAEGALVRLHVCGQTNHLLRAFSRVGADMVELDHPVDFPSARGKVGPEAVLLGNMDPVAIVRNGRPAEIIEACRACHEAAGERYILAAGCEIPPDTPAENVRAMVDYARGAA
jgi:MtaA/CmuA family methyltransferase